VSCLKIHPIYPCFISGSWDRSVRQWDLNTGIPLREYQSHASQLTGIEFRPSTTVQGDIFQTISIDGICLLWDIRTPQPIRKLSPAGIAPPWALSVSTHSHSQYTSSLSLLIIQSRLQKHY